MLIGVKDTPNTLIIPSGTSFVDPRGPAAWSSAFGDKNVLDFRVQISKSKDFRHTRAHWYVTLVVSYIADVVVLR